MSDYPIRREILLPLLGDLFTFVQPIKHYLDLLDEQQKPQSQELFKFYGKRGWRIIEYVTHARRWLYTIDSRNEVEIFLFSS